ncbi:UDP-glucose 4-epimerase GalE [Cellulosilyticum ruminicola]|uniref:UDP-glucose 4-epimerase GalE n=1 Tax=Cellulosilyticum ruminicola TaxID=425254 RepID=UPI0006D20B7C
MGILVTGGTGYIGSHTVVELLEIGEEVIIVDNLCNSSIDVLDKIEMITGKRPVFYEIDLLDKEKLEFVFKEHQIESVIHFAGLKAVGESVKIPLTYYENNITGTLNLCKIMEKYECRNLVFSSSATVYGMNNTAPFREDMPLSTTNPYGTTKLMIENILRDLYVANHDWHIVLLRYFNPIGAHESGLLGENPKGIPNNLLPYVMQVAIGKLECLSIYGDDYDTKDGTGVRDYIHVVDLAKGHISAVEYARKHEGAEAINLGTGNGYSVLEVVKAFEEASHKHVNYRIAPRRDGDIAICYADASKAKKLLNWEAQKTIDEMCMDSYRFIEKLANA